MLDRFTSFDAFLRSMGGLRAIANDPWAVVIELLLIGLAVNWCAGVLAGTRGTRPLRGLLLVLIVATLAINALAAQYDWPRLELLYRGFLVGLVIIALVAFQPELRRAVIRAGDVRFLRRGARPSKVIGALVGCARYLSKNRYGGLIAIQRTVDLTGWAEKGTLINAEISATLLNSIFFPNTPLHDLGVVVADNRVVAANCQFPIVESDEVQAALGSRHLAAVGMSYESDALVLVVSEETGTISLADHGKLTRFLSIDDLEDELTRRLGAASPGRPTSLRSVAHLTWRATRRLLVVVPLTLTIWIVASQWTQAQIEGVPVQLDVRLADPQRALDVLSPPRGVFRVSFQGTARAVEALREFTDDRPLRLDWLLKEPSVRDREEVRPARELLDNLPAIQKLGLSVERVAPSHLRFAVHDLETVTMGLTADAGAVRVGDVRFEPERVQVTLRADDLAELRRRSPAAQWAVPVPVEDQLRGVPPEQPMTLRDVRVADHVLGLRIFDVQPKVVNVTLRVVGQRKPHRFTGVPVVVQASPDLLEQYDVRRIDEQEWLAEIEVDGDARQVTELQLNPQKLRAYVTITSADLRAGEVIRRSVEVDVPAGIDVVHKPSVQFRLVRREERGP